MFRRYAPAFTTLRDGLLPPDADGRRGYNEYPVIASIGTAEAIAFLFDELQRFAGPLDARGKRSLLHLVVALSGAPREAAARVEAGISRIPHRDDAEVLERCIPLVRVARDPAAIDLMLEVFGDNERLWHKARDVLHRADDGWVRMPENRRPPRTDVVDVLLAVGAEEPCALGAGDEHRASADGAKGAHRAVHAAGEECLGLLE